MKFKVQLLLFFFCISSLYTFSFAQQNAEKQIINGLEYYVYSVKQGEGLYSISQKYGVSQEDINKLNPKIKNGLRAGQVILIPIKKKKQVEQGFILHQVKDDQTLFAISKKYNVAIEKIISANSEIGKDGEIKAGMFIKIPTQKEKKNVSVIDRIKNKITTKKRKNKYKIAYLLPFMSSHYGSNVNPTATKFIQFYMGSLLAINNHKNHDVTYEIFAYDIEKSEQKLHEVLNNPQMQDMDLIFGPAYTAQVPVLVDFAKRRRIYTVVPFSPNIENLESNPYVFQFNSTQEYKNEITIDFIKKNYFLQNILIVKTGVTYPNHHLKEWYYLKNKMSGLSIPYKEISKNNLVGNLSKKEKNLIIFDAEKHQNVKELLNYLQQLSSEYDIAVLGQYAWRGTEGAKPKMYYITSFKGKNKGTTYYETEYRKFYGEKQPILNPRFDLLGYDLTTFFISIVSASQKGLTFKRQPKLVWQGVESDFIFEKQGRKGGYMNKELFLITDEATQK